MRAVYVAIGVALLSVFLVAPPEGIAQKSKPAEKKAKKDSTDKVIEALVAERKKLANRLQEIYEKLHELDFPKWTMDPKEVQFPDIPVFGKVHGRPFRLESTKFSSVSLELIDGQTRISIFHGIKAGQGLPGVRIESDPGRSSTQRRPVFIHTPDGGAGAASSKYLLRVEFGEAKDGEVPGKIYFSTADRSVIAGTFNVRVR